MKPQITYADFAKLDLRVGEVRECTPKEDSEKLLRLVVNFGEEERIILSGLAPWYTPEELIGRQFIFVYNLEPRKMMGEESAGMILATDDDKPLMLVPLEKSTPGTSIR